MPIKTLLSNKVFLAFFPAVAILLVSFVVFAFSKDDIVFPVPELGNCVNEEECRAWCDEGDNMESCLNFAQKHNLMSARELEKAEKFLASGLLGPGGCSSHFECENYCGDISNIDECLAFAESSGMMQGQELQEAKQIQQALAKGAKMPGSCRNRQECENYCSNPGNMEECLIFAEAAGFMPPGELEEARKVLAAVKRGVQPPPCMGRGGRDTCESYCRQPENFEMCISFAREAGLMSDRELQNSEKMLTAIRKGVKPPPCQSEQECNVYCSQEAHIQECIVFAEAAGFMTPEEAEMARKTGGTGPGDCRGEEECRAFCENPANQEICFNFAVEHDLLSEEDMRQMEEGLRQMQEGLASAPPEVVACLEEKLGVDAVAGIRSGSGVPTPQMGDIMRGCFEQFMPSPEDFGPPPGVEQGSFPPEGFEPPQAIPSGFTGPGGCAGPEECQLYCSDPANQQECGQFAPPPSNYQPPSDYQPPSEEQPPSGFLRQIRQAAASLFTNFLNLIK